jgi:hypothetical protein
MLKILIVLIALLLLFDVSLTCAQSLSDAIRDEQKNIDCDSWMQERAQLFKVEYGAGLDPMEIDQRARFDYQCDLGKNGDPVSKTILDLLNFTDNAIMNEDLGAISKLVGINETLLKLDPTLGNRIWYQQLMTTATVIIQCNFEIINGTVVPRDKKTNPLNITHSSKVHSDLITVMV